MEMFLIEKKTYFLNMVEFYMLTAESFVERQMFNIYEEQGDGDGEVIAPEWQEGMKLIAEGLSDIEQMEAFIP